MYGPAPSFKYWFSAISNIDRNSPKPLFRSVPKSDRAKTAGGAIVSRCPSLFALSDERTEEVLAVLGHGFGDQLCRHKRETQPETPLPQHLCQLGSPLLVLSWTNITHVSPRLERTIRRRLFQLLAPQQGLQSIHERDRIAKHIFTDAGDGNTTVVDSDRFENGTGHHKGLFADLERRVGRVEVVAPLLSIGGELCTNMVSCCREEVRCRRSSAHDSPRL